MLSNYNFFLQVSELNKKLDELSLKGWIRPCKDITLVNFANCARGTTAQELFGNNIVCHQSCYVSFVYIGKLERA